MLRAVRYAKWIDLHRWRVVILSILIVGVCAIYASRLSLASDLTALLPSGQQSIRDLKSLQQRVIPFATLQMVVEGPSLQATSQATDAVVKRLAPIAADTARIRQLSQDDGPRLRYAWAHRFLFAKLDELVAARDALNERVQQAKLDANPLFISLDDDEPAKQEPAPDRLAELETRLAELEANVRNPPRTASKDGMLQVISLQTAFSASDTSKGRALVSDVQTIVRELERENPGVTFGITGNVLMALHEHDSVIDGMAWSLALTLLLVGGALWLYYRAGRLVLAMLWALAVGALGTFALTWVLYERLNVMTAFLLAIVVGNGINPALILVSRFLEELRRSDDEETIGQAIAGSLPGTLGAAATAAIAYTSLVITDFRGFREFGAIGGIGMVLTWITTFTVLPALLAILRRRGLPRTSSPLIGDWLARLFPASRYRMALVASCVITAAALAVTVVYIANDPFTHDWRDLQSTTSAIKRGHALNEKLKTRLQRSELTGSAYQLIVAVDRREQVGPLLAQLRKVNENVPEPQRWMHDVVSIEDALPSEQAEKLAVLADIRRVLDSPEVIDALGPADAARLSKLRPPDDLAPVTDADIPHEIAWPFTERDGSRGRLMLLRGAARFNSFDVDDRLLFADKARELALPAGTLLAGESLVIADIIEVMERDAPKMVAFALIGSILAVFLFVGVNRHGAVTIIAGIAGVVLMIATCAIVGLEVHFLDLIALPISIGIGIDYAVNVAARERQDGEHGVSHVLQTTGGAVVLCSYTTSVGYGTLLLSANGGIRAFGLAALIGEVCCVLMAVLAAPAALAWLRQRRSS